MNCRLKIDSTHVNLWAYSSNDDDEIVWFVHEREINKESTWLKIMSNVSDLRYALIENWLMNCKCLF